MVNLRIEGKVLFFKFLAIPKIVYLSLMTVVHAIINQLNIMQKTFIWNEKNPSSTPSKNIQHFEAATKTTNLKDVDVFAKVISLRCSSIKRLFDEHFHKRKIIPAYLIKTEFCENFKFRPFLKPSIG